MLEVVQFLALWCVRVSVSSCPCDWSCSHLNLNVKRAAKVSSFGEVPGPLHGRTRGYGHGCQKKLPEQSVCLGLCLLHVLSCFLRHLIW